MANGWVQEGHRAPTVLRAAGAERLGRRALLGTTTHPATHRLGRRCDLCSRLPQDEVHGVVVQVQELGQVERGAREQVRGSAQVARRQALSQRRRQAQARQLTVRLHR